VAFAIAEVSFYQGFID
jgi:hypothetical protein